MITIPFEQLVAMILEKKTISRGELDSRIKTKMDQLSGLISKEGAAHIVANELGIKLLDATGGKMKIGKILGGMRDIETAGKVLQVFDVKEFQSKLGPGKVGAMIVGDETGQIRVVLWNEMAGLIEKTPPGTIVRVLGAYARQNNDRKELHLNAKSKLVINPPGEDIKVAIPQGPKRVQISELAPEQGTVELKATVVQVFDLRFYEVCSQCQKRATQGANGWECAVHGQVTPGYSYALTFYADDGSGNIRAVCFGNAVEAMTGKSHDELLKIKEEPAGFDTGRNELLGTQLILRGRANKNQMFDRTEFVVNSVHVIDVDKEIAALKQRVSEEKKVSPELPKTANSTPSTANTSPKTVNPKPETPKPASPKKYDDDDSEESAEDFDIDEELI